MEVFAEARRARLLEEAETRRLLKAARASGETERETRERRRGAIWRGLAWLAKQARPGRPAAAS